MKQGYTRRGFIKGSTLLAAGVAMPAILNSSRVFAGETLVVRDMGGAFYEGFKTAFYDTFTAETGVTIQVNTNEPDPIPQYKMAVDTDTKLFDVALMTPEHVLRIRQLGDNYLLPLNLNMPAGDEFIPHSFEPDFAGVAIFALAMGYRTDTMGTKPPTSWQDFWNVEDFKGRRGLWRSPVTTLEMALLADGVPLDQLYPLDVERAFASLDKIKNNIDIWWTSGAHATQLLQNGELDLMSTWSTRAQAAIDSGAPAAINWNGGLFNIDGWTIPANTDKPELARKFIEWCLDAQRQAAYTPQLACGPTNTRAYDYIPAEKAALLPTFPTNIKNLVPLNAAYWAEHQDALTERFEQWILS